MDCLTIECGAHLKSLIAVVHGQRKWKDRQTLPHVVAAYIVSAKDLIVTLHNKLPSHDLVIYF